jgi:hypothetical protein
MEMFQQMVDNYIDCLFVSLSSVIITMATDMGARGSAVG